MTIPSRIRESLHLSKDSVLSVVKVGSGILLMPKASRVDAVAEKFSKTAKEKGITLDNLMRDLRKNRQKDA